jgi:beta-N-acetylhexosaminidase
MRWFSRCALNLIVVVALLVGWSHTAPVHAQEDPDKFVAKILAQMTPDVKVGQLFVITFPGTDTSASSDVSDLVLNYHVGGVMLATAGGNMVNSVDAPTQVAALTASLQGLAQRAANVPGTAGRTTPFIPLFIALEQNGNGLPDAQLTGGMSPLPSAMALGATWKPDDATAVGKVVGTELAAVGVNLLVGPSLDVLDASNPSDAGVNAFSGDPYWVRLMGQNYVRGLNAGSQGRVAAVLTDFPGQGSALDADGVVNRSLEELKKVELTPYLSMVQPAAGEPRALADALMTSHVRYRGFFGNIRERTAPVSVDAQAMQALLALPEVKAWRDGGGVLVSGSLGSPLIRRYYDTQGLPLPPQRVAQDALFAFNDVLVLSDFGTTGLWSEQLANIKSVIQFFQDKYSTDLTFQARVDDAVTRILRLKVRLYPGFDATSVAVNPVMASTIVGHSRATTLKVAQDALTLLAPSAATLAEKPLPVPAPQDSILIFTDDRLYKECPTCQVRPLLAADALQQAIVRLYPSRIDAARITSISYISLTAFLNGTLAGPTPDIGAAFSAANWVIFATLDVSAATPQSTALRQLVIQRPNLLANKKVVIFAFDAPYDLDPEVVSKATAVYGLYSRTDPFIEVAARALFGDARPQGNPPVSVDAIHYQIIVQTEPNPNQVIELFVGDVPKDTNATPVPVEIKVGDTLKLRTGIILDRNGHPVPDDTKVVFSRTFSQTVDLPPLVAPTRSGVATVSFVLDRIGPLRVRASSDPALTSFTLQLTVGEQPSKPEFITPTLSPPQPTATSTSTPIPTSTPTPTPPPEPPAPTSRRVGWSDLMTALAGVIVIGGTGYWTQRARKRNETDAAAISRAVRCGLWSVLTGLTGYVLYGMDAPGSDLVRTRLGAWAALPVAVIFGMIPVLIALIRSRILDSRSLGGFGFWRSNQKKS